MKDIQKIKEFFSKPMEEAMDANDPVLMKARAAAFQRSQPKPEPAKPSKAVKNADKIKALKLKRAQLMRDMEQEAEPEGGPIADRYGRELEKIDKAIAMLSEAKKETAVDMAKKKLDALGVKYEMSKTDKVRPFKAIYKPVNKSDEFYDKFNDIIDLFNLKGFVKTSMNEASPLTKVARKIGWAGEDWTPQEFATQIKNLSDETLLKWAESNKGIGKGIPNTPLAFQQKLVKIELAKRGLNEAQSLTGGYPHKKTSGADFEKIEITEPMDDATKSRMIKNFRAAGWDAKPNNGGGITAVKKSIMEANSIDDFKNNLPNTGLTMDNLKKLASLKSPEFESSPSALTSMVMNSVEFDVNKAGLNINDLSTEDLDRLRYKWARLKGLLKVKDTLSSMYGKRGEKINQDKDISSTLTYNLNETKKEDAIDTITMDIPLFLRMLEYSREDASQDMDLHDVTEKANKLGKEKGILSMEDYEEIVGAAEEIDEAVNLKASKLSTSEYQKAKKLKDFKASDWKYDSKEDLYTKVNEGKLNEANVPSNIAEFAKRKGVSSLVRKVAGWAEKVGARIAGGTAVGKNYSTLVLDLDYKQQGEVRINTDMETVTLYNKPVTSFPEFKRAYEANKPVEEVTDYMKRRKAMDDYAINKKDKPKKPTNPKYSGNTDYMKRRQKDLAEAILSKLKK